MAELPLPVCWEEQARALPHLDYNLKLETRLQIFLNCAAARYNTFKKKSHVLHRIILASVDWMKLSNDTSSHSNIIWTA